MIGLAIRSKIQRAALCVQNDRCDQWRVRVGQTICEINRQSSLCRNAYCATRINQCPKFMKLHNLPGLPVKIEHANDKLCFVMSSDERRCMSGGGRYNDAILLVNRNPKDKCVVYTIDYTPDLGLLQVHVVNNGFSFQLLENSRFGMTYVMDSSSNVFFDLCDDGSFCYRTSDDKSRDLGYSYFYRVDGCSCSPWSESSLDE